jgi:RNA polymerase sigma-70 factor (ECF subfamily)
MAAAQLGDAEAYAELLNEIGPLLMSFLRGRVRDVDEAEDIYQDTFMALHRARHTYDATRPLEPWLFAIARHIVADHAERRRARHAREVLVAAPPEPWTESDGHLKPQLEQALRRMSGDQRQAIALLRVEGLPIESAARRAGTTTGALRVRVHRAYKALRQLL